jgi:hypothetical protein
MIKMLGERETEENKAKLNGEILLYLGTLPRGSRIFGSNHVV